MSKNIITLLVLLAVHAIGFADQKCISGSPESTHLIDQLKSEQNKQGVAYHISQKYSLLPRTEAGSADGCVECAKKANQGRSPGNAELSPIVVPKSVVLFKKECLEIAGSVTAHANEIICPEGKIGKFKSCFTSDILQYENAVVTDFYRCIKKMKPDLPIEGDALFEMFSLESGFKPHYASVGGVGIGQLTSIFVKDVRQEHRGGKLLDALATSSESDCSAARLLAYKDTHESSKMNLGTKANRCAFTQLGGGMERNILYSLIGMATHWEKDIAPVMNRYIQKCERDPRFKADEKFRSDLSRAKQLALLNSYGHGGLAAARAAVRHLSHLKNPSDFVSRIQRPLAPSEDDANLTSYLVSMKARQKQLASKFEEPMKTEFIQSGAKACVQ